MAHNPEDRQGHHQGLQRPAPGEVFQKVPGELGDGEDVDQVEEELKLGDFLFLAGRDLQGIVKAGHTYLSCGRQILTPTI